MASTASADDASVKSASTAASLIWQAPIVVGYAFGPKKMSTMGTVMAEASKTEVLWELEHEDSDDDDDDRSDRSSHNNNGGRNAVGVEENSSDGGANTGSPHDTHNDSRRPRHESHGAAISSPAFPTNIPPPAAAAAASRNDRSLTTEALRSMEASPTHAVIFSIGRYGTDDVAHPVSATTPVSAAPNTSSAGTGFVTTDLKHIVRYFRSSCSSTGGSIVADDELSSSPTVTSATTGTSHTTTTMALHRNGKDSDCSVTVASGSRKRPLAPIRLSFVPLNPNQPLHEQGKFDLILHKLTEDILSCSLQQQRDKLLLKKGIHVDRDSPSASSSTTNCSAASSQQQQQLSQQQQQQPSQAQAHRPSPEQESQDRVQRLLRYKAEHPQCCLVDDPLSVQTLMSRADIAHVLHSCLDGVKSGSGRSVRTPRYVVVENDDDDDQDSESENGRDVVPDGAPHHEHRKQRKLQRKLDDAGVSYPLIVKPLIAAGTKQSHYMSVLLAYPALAEFVAEDSVDQPESSDRRQSVNKPGTIDPRTYRSFLFQEYVNHNATLYKVYVLGDTVHVYQRHSLPDLPPLSERNSDCVVHCVEFDSQHPYPKLQEFGFAGSPQEQERYSSETVTCDEVRPIVETLRRAFGLELFGFDILLSSSSNEFLVVDVNYFPSYKEVPDFPSVLAQYLTQRVLESRRERYCCSEMLK